MAITLLPPRSDVCPPSGRQTGEAEAALHGKRLDKASARDAAQLAFANAVTHGGNDFKPELGRRTLVRALLQAAAMEV